MKLLTIEQAASFLGLKVSRLRYEVFLKRIPYTKIGKSLRFLEEDLNEWVLTKRKEVANAPGK